MIDPTPSRRSVASMFFVAVALCLASCSTSSSRSGKHFVDFSRYDQPLHDQVIDQIRAKVLARLGAGKTTQDRFFIIPFAYQNEGHDPEFSHSFITVIRVFAQDKPHQGIPELQTREYKGREFEAFTISWLPRDFAENPHLCVFEGFGALLIPSWNKCPLSEGKSFDLAVTLKLASDAKVAVGMWGPYEITQAGFDLGIKRLRLLEKGTVKYRADDRLYRKRMIAINCFHAMASLSELFPAGGIFDTGFKMWGINGTKQVLREYTTRASNKGMLLEPVDIDKDVFGYVYAPERNPEGVFNPFEKAFAYRK